MLEFGNKTTSNAHVFDVTEATFMSEVVEASATTPVIVDFWAPWCGPCKTLGPALEAAVNAAGGKVKMAKVDIDQNQMLASQMRVQSIPAVFAFVNGQPVDGFMGAKPPSELSEFVKKIAAMGGDQKEGGLEQALAAADEMLAAGEAVDAAETYAAILGEEPQNAPAFIGLCKAQMAVGGIEVAQNMLENIPDGLRDNPEVIALRTQLELSVQSAKLGSTEQLLAQIDAEPANHQARFDLALVQFTTGQEEEAIDNLLEIFRRERDWNDDGARKQLFKFFDSLGAENPKTLLGRRKLASMLFA